LVERVPSVLGLSELQKIAVARVVLRPIRKPMGVSAFGVNAWTGERAGDLVIEPHDETNPGSGKHEELYVVMTGHAEFELAGETVDAPAGTFVLAQPDQHRSAKAKVDDTTILVIGGKPGAAGPPSPFEYYFLAAPAYDAGDFAGAYAMTAEGLEHHPDNASLQFNLACFAAMAGQREDALRHARRAFELDPKTREWAAKDSDLDSVRDQLGL
jgi:hypothetical protein